MAKTPKLYLDTNILLDLIRERHGLDESRQVLELARRKKCQLITSVFATLELLQGQQEYLFIRREILERGRTWGEVRSRIYRRNLSQQELESTGNETDRFLDDLIQDSGIEIIRFEADWWESVIALMAQINVGLADAIHVTVAIEEGCDFFVTRDSALRTVIGGDIPAIEPSGVEEVV